ncbi:MAG: hypothetical protein SF182_15470 [Deltaproteobacteria bacterium]|nr:hypothetical protein [Deltaproteobacteria bacterium]
MSRNLRSTLLGLAAAAAAALAPAASQAICGDLNNDGVRTAADAIVLSQCIANGGTCPTPVCGGGGLAACADVLGDGDVSFPVGQNADLAVLLQSLAGLSTLYDICTGPGPNIACPGGNVTIPSGPITTSQTWPASCKVTLGGTVLVETPAGGPTTVLRVEKGSIVQGDAGAVDPATLIFLPGSHADMQGTSAQPIVFTSNQPAGAKTPGGWGGIMFNGKSTVNGPNCQFQAEGVPEPFGGCVANDSSGIVTFFRSEFGGKLFTPDNELNSFTMNGIGSQTQFNFVQGHAGKDDCLEWFGGTSNHNHMVASACADDAFDWQLGFTGSVQFGVYMQNGGFTDAGNRDSRGIEADNSEFDNAALPFSDPDLCNMTIVGGKAQVEFADNGGSDSGILFRRGTRGQVANAVVTGFQDAGLELRDASTTQGACVDGDANKIPESLTGNLVVRNSVFYDNGSAGAEQAKDNDGTLDTTAGADLNACVAANCRCDSETFYDLLVSGFNVANANGTPLGSQVNPGVSDEYPALDSAACTGTGTPYTCCTGAGTGTCRALPDFRATGGGLPAAFACKNINPLFSNVSYIGGVNPGVAYGATSYDWLSKPWLEFGVQ